MLSGPTARGSGVDWDLRRDMPYGGYDQLEFKVPVDTAGDVFARYQIRMEELRQSISMVKQAIANLPDGPIKADAPKIVLPDREKMKTQMESLIHQFKIVTEGFTVPEGEVYQGVESPRGEMGYYVCQRRHRQALSRPYAQPFVCQPERHRGNVRTQPAGRRGRRHRQHRHRPGRRRSLEYGNTRNIDR